MLKIAALVAAALIVAVLVYATTKPDTFRLERTIAINAPPERIFPLINDFQAWAIWSPYDKKDPNMKRELSGPPSGVGAAYAWNGNNDIGAGRMEILESVPSSLVKIDLHFTRPMEARNTAEFTLAPDGTGTTRVSWAMYGPSPYLSKLMSVFLNFDKMIGADFEAGLVAMKTAAELEPEQNQTPAEQTAE